MFRREGGPPATRLTEIFGRVISKEETGKPPVPRLNHSIRDAEFWEWESGREGRPLWVRLGTDRE